MDHVTDQMRRMTVATGASHDDGPSIKPMRRPGFGKAGQRIVLDSNFFRMKLPEKLVITQFAVSICQFKHPSALKANRGKSKPRVSDEQYEAEKKWTETAPLEPIFFNRNVFNQFLSTHARNLRHSIVYDGRSIAYAPQNQVSNNFLGHYYELEVGRDGASPKSSERQENKVIKVQVQIKHAKDLRLADFLRGQVDTTASSNYLAAIDTILAHAPTEKYVQVGRCFYDPRQSTPLGRFQQGATVSAWRGFYQSARTSQVGLVLNLDESFTAFWNFSGRPLMELVRSSNKGRDPWHNQQALKRIATELKMLKVRALHTGITYKVYGFSNTSADRLTFVDHKSGRTLSVAEYFTNTYNQRLRHADLPCVITSPNPKNPRYLPAEMLIVEEKQRVMGLLSAEQTASMVRCASSKPHIRQSESVQTIQHLGISQDPMCKSFGLQVQEKMISVNARVLPPPPMLYRTDKGSTAVRVSNGMWRYDRSTRLYNPISLVNWVVFYESRGLNGEELGNFIDALIKSARYVGMTINKPVLVKSEPNQFTAMIHRANSNLNRDPRNPLQMSMFVKNLQETPGYNAIKKVGDTELAIPTQVILTKNVQKNLNNPNPRGLNMFCENVLMKMNTKLGGQNVRVGVYKNQSAHSPIPDAPFLDKPHIILGADVTHPMPGGKSPSVAALVGSMDREAIQFSGTIRSQKGRQEVMSEFGDMFTEVYTNWRNRFGNKIDAQNVIMFRDGVSEGQFEAVMSQEVESLRRACQSMNFKPKITYIIVTKRHHTKFFPGRTNDRSGNIAPGTVVDRDITSAEYYDFYLNSHAGIQGTNKPSKYTVLVDESGMTPDALQAFVFRLAHGFARCNRSVSMVNAAYYAHLLAFRARAYMDDFSDKGSVTSSSSNDSVSPAPRIPERLARRLYFV